MFDNHSAAIAYFASLDEHRERERQRTAIINADPRIVYLRSLKDQTTIESADALMADLLSGKHVNSARINRLIRARIGQLDKNRAAIQVNLREAAECRRTHWSLVA